MPIDNYGRAMADAAQFAQMPVNALLQRRESDAVDARRNQLMQHEQRQMDEEDRFHQALQTGDFDTAAQIDPQATSIYQEHLRQKAMSGLGDIPITAKREAVPEVPGQLVAKPMGGGVTAYMQDGKLVQGGLKMPEKADKPQGPTEDERNTARYLAMSEPQRALYDRMHGRNQNSGAALSVGPNGELSVNPASIKASDGERKTAALGVRLEAALQNLNAITSRSPGSVAPTVTEKAAGGVGGEMAANWARAPDRRQADAAQEDALDAALTLATGAAYTPEQKAGLKKAYFPQIGDDDATKKFKQQQFMNIVQAARVNAGRAEPLIDSALQQSGQEAGGGAPANKRVSFKDIP